jgi:sterol desaturase/sphingolipid hydroxylase (fatty acid hydroxylase superfamily)
MDFANNMTIDNLHFVVEPVSGWTIDQWILFPWLFSVPAEILALIVDAMIYFTIGKPDLPHRKSYPALTFNDYWYTYFNRIIGLPFVSWLNLRVVNASSAMVFDPDGMTLMNTLVAFVIVFALSDLVYYTGHRIVHKFEPLYVFVHKHHHQESAPRRGWFDTSNAHPTDFFYTGISTTPISVLWLMPAGSIHIYTIAALGWVNLFVGCLGHCRLDLDIGIFRTRFHAGHHAYSTCNFAQNIELWDRMFGTFRELGANPNKEANIAAGHLE